MTKAKLSVVNEDEFEFAKVGGRIHLYNLNDEKTISKLVKDVTAERASYITIDDVTSLGRSPKNTIFIHNPFVSGEHALISPHEDGSYRIRDLGSKNKTYLDGKPLNPNKDYKLESGDKIDLAKVVVLKFEEYNNLNTQL